LCAVWVRSMDAQRAACDGCAGKIAHLRTFAPNEQT
jgi:hypothetical protein